MPLACSVDVALVSSPNKKCRKALTRNGCFKKNMSPILFLVFLHQQKRNWWEIFVVLFVVYMVLNHEHSCQFDASGDQIFKTPPSSLILPERVELEVLFFPG